MFCKDLKTKLEISVHWVYKRFLICLEKYLICQKKHIFPQKLHHETVGVAISDINKFWSGQPHILALPPLQLWCWLEASQYACTSVHCERGRSLKHFSSEEIRLALPEKHDVYTTCTRLDLFLFQNNVQNHAGYAGKRLFETVSEGSIRRSHHHCGQHPASAAATATRRTTHTCAQRRYSHGRNYFGLLMSPDTSKPLCERKVRDKESTHADANTCIFHKSICQDAQFSCPLCHQLCRLDPRQLHMIDNLWTQKAMRNMTRKYEIKCLTGSPQHADMLASLNALHVVA